MDIYLMGVYISWRQKDREVEVDIYLLGVAILWRRTDRDLGAMTVTTMRARSGYVMVCQSIVRVGALPTSHGRWRKLPHLLPFRLGVTPSLARFSCCRTVRPKTS